MIILVTGTFKETGSRGEYLRSVWGVSHGIDYDTGDPVITSGGTPQELGGEYYSPLGEWVIFESAEERNYYMSKQ